MKYLLKFFGFLLRAALTGLLLGCFALLGVYLYLEPMLPSIDDLQEVRLQVPLRVYSREVIDEITSSDPAAKKIYDSYHAFQIKAANWAEISEKAYYNTIQG